jgi:uncharacterized membrane protein (UPF0127 family)
MCSDRKKYFLFCVFISSMIALAACACRSRTAQENPPAKREDRVILTTPGREPVEVVVEIAATPTEQVKGLMYRKNLDPLHGMLFIYSDEAQRNFWMKNTYIELDMIFIRSDGSVLGCVERAEPLTETPRFVTGNSQYVLEVAGGFCAKYGVGASTVAQFILNKP